MTLSKTLPQPAKYDFAGDFWSEHSLSLNGLAAPGAQKWLYSVWDEPAPAHDHAPRRSEGWPQVVCKEGSD